MNRLRVLIAGIVLCLIGVTAVAQERVYKDGPVTELSYIKVKPGKFDDYVKWLATGWKTDNDAMKKAGFITSYAVYSAYSRSPTEPDLILAITYPNMAALDRGEEMEAASMKQSNTTSAQQNKQYIDRGAMRDVLGSELVREIVFK